MLDLEDEVAFAIWTSDTGNASRADWDAYPRKDNYQRMAKAAIVTIQRLQRS